MNRFRSLVEGILTCLDVQKSYQPGANFRIFYSLQYKECTRTWRQFHTTCCLFYAFHFRNLVIFP